MKFKTKTLIIGALSGAAMAMTHYSNFYYVLIRVILMSTAFGLIFRWTKK